MPDVKVIKVGGQSMLDRGRAAIFPLLDELVAVKDKYQLLLCCGGGTRARHIYSIASELEMPTGVLAALGGYVPRQNARMLQMLLAKHGGVFMMHDDFEKLPLYFKLGCIPIMTGMPPFGYWEKPGKDGRIPANRTDAGVFLSAEVLGVKRALFIKDEDGLYTDDPKKNPAATHIPRIGARELLEERPARPHHRARRHRVPDARALLPRAADRQRARARAGHARARGRRCRAPSSTRTSGVRRRRNPVGRRTAGARASSSRRRRAGAASPTLKVAAAADLALAFQDVGAAYQKKTGERVIFSFGSTGLLEKQIAEGAPFDVFAAANVSFADDAIKAGACARRLARRSTPAGASSSGGSKGTALRAAADRSPTSATARFVKVAIANPAHAPYGQAAEQAMKKAGVWAGAAAQAGLRRERAADAPVRPVGQRRGRRWSRCRWR